MKASKCLRIGIDLRFVSRGRGLGNVTAGLVEGLARISTGHHFVLYSGPRDRSIQADGSELEWKEVARLPHPLWEQLYLPHLASRDRLDVLHCVGNTGPVRLRREIGLVLTLHDVIFMQPERSSILRRPLYQRLGAAYRRAVVPLVARRADAITTDSESARGEIIAILGLAASKVRVISPAPRTIFRRLTQTAIDELLPPSTPAAAFLLALGGTDRRKNTIAIVDAFASLRPAQRLGHKLVVVGLGANASASLLTHARRLGVEDSVVSLGQVRQPSLVALYNQATALVYASTWEGFGLPVLEAMACGTAVIASNVGAIAEVAGGAALPIDPHSLASIARGMVSVIGDRQVRKRLVADGFRRCGTFQWDEAARHMVPIYESVAGSSTAYKSAIR